MVFPRFPFVIQRFLRQSFRMLIVFGPISMELHLPVKAFPAVGGEGEAGDYTLNAGGRGANQALAAARSGAKVALIGKTGDDDYSKRILEKIRRDGVVTSGVGRSEKNHTGTDVICKDKKGETLKIKSLAANNEAAAEQVPDEILDENTLILVQTDLPLRETTELLQKAKAQGARTIMNLAPAIQLSKPLLDTLDYMIVNQAQANELSEKLGMPKESGVDKIAIALAQLGDLTCIITTGANGSICYDSKGKGWRVKTLKIDGTIDNNGIEDVYCGTFAACLQASMPIHKAMKRAGLAASLACTREGTQNSFPYLAEIDERIDELPEPEGI